MNVLDFGDMTSLIFQFISAGGLGFAVSFVILWFKKFTDVVI